MRLRTRITLALISIVLLSLVVIGIVTVLFFSSQNEQYHQERLQRKERTIKMEMAYFSKEVELQGNADIVLKGFEEEVLRLATLHNLEINVFNTKGLMLVSARPDSLHKDYTKKKVPLTAFEELQHVNRIVIPETEGSRNYLSDYTNLKNAKGERIAILNIPYLQDTEAYQAELNRFLRSIGIVYIFILIGALIITVILSNSLTKNLQSLSQKIKGVDLSKPQEKLNWSGDQELEVLVLAYNQMIEKLEESKRLLAQKERESAWREMAKQVAHEIKNPLTPIKLSIQHLSATANYESDVWRTKFKRTMEMITEQIESLNKIASEFSQFAKLPDGNKESVSLSQALQSVTTLFESAPVEINLQLPAKDAVVQGDKERVGRVFNNLVKNAKQALSEIEHGVIDITLSQKDNHAIVSIRDNGKGISKELQSKIFEPNFTTKSSGTGLGLAISKQIIEQAHGTIWFESERNKGTTFWVKIPLKLNS